MIINQLKHFHHILNKTKETLEFKIVEKISKPRLKPRLPRDRYISS